MKRLVSVFEAVAVFNRDMAPLQLAVVFSTQGFEVMCGQKCIAAFSGHDIKESAYMAYYSHQVWSTCVSYAFGCAKADEELDAFIERVSPVFPELSDVRDATPADDFYNYVMWLVANDRAAFRHKRQMALAESMRLFLLD